MVTTVSFIQGTHFDKDALPDSTLQERAGVKMVMIQDGPQNTGADKPLRISGEPFKVQVGPCSCERYTTNIMEL